MAKVLEDGVVVVVAVVVERVGLAMGGEDVERELEVTRLMG